MGRILIIDDNKSLGDGLVLSLNKMGHQAVATGSGREGLARMKDEPFDLVITDYRMEEMDGLAVMEAVQRQAPETDVMMMTAYDTRELAVEAMERGAIDFIVKPFPPDELWLKVNKRLDYRAKLREAQAKLREAQTLRQEAEAKLRDWEHLFEQNRYLREEIDSRYNFGEIVGPIPADQGRARASAQGSVVIVVGTHLRGKRHWQGAGCSRHPLSEPPQQGAVRQGQLRCLADWVGRKRVVWARARGFYQRGAEQEGQV